MNKILRRQQMSTIYARTPSTNTPVSVCSVSTEAERDIWELGTDMTLEDALDIVGVFLAGSGDITEV